MVKYVTFNHHYVGSNPAGLNNGHRLMVDRSSSKRCVSIRFRLAVYRVSNLIGKVLSCREGRCGFESRLTR